MVKYKYIGKTTYQYGKTLWEIIGNLKDYGVGRLVTRGTWSHFPEPSFIKIIKSEAYQQTEVGPDKYRHCIVWAEKTFRGMPFPELIEIHKVSFKPDYRLIPRDEEHLWYERVANTPKPKPNIPPTHISVPPVLKLILNEERQSKGLPIDEDMVTPAIIRKEVSNLVPLQYVKDLPEKRVSDGYGKSPNQSLYENIEAYKINILNENKSE